MAPNSTKEMERHKSEETFRKRRDTRKHKHVEKAVVFDPSKADTDSDEGEPFEVESESIIYREPTADDNLQTSLGSSNKAVAYMNKRR